VLLGLHLVPAAVMIPALTRSLRARSGDQGAGGKSSSPMAVSSSGSAK
jgi:hypothetical protein